MLMLIVSTYGEAPYRMTLVLVNTIKPVCYLVTEYNIDCSLSKMSNHTKYGFLDSHKMYLYKYRFHN